VRGTCGGGSVVDLPVQQLAHEALEVVLVSSLAGVILPLVPLIIILLLLLLFLVLG
jgi:hypothetical protein